MSELNVDFCCTCLKVFTKKDELINLSLKTSQEISYRNKLKSCVPEMILQNTEDCFLCGSCAMALENAYTFRCMCLITDNKLKEYRALQQRKDICSVREDLLQVLSQEIQDIEQENSSVIEAKELGSLLTETLIKQESNTALRSIKAEIDEFVLSSEPHLSDAELIQKACSSIPELKNIPASGLNCRVALEKIVVKELPVIIPSDNDQSGCPKVLEKKKNEVNKKKPVMEKCIFKIKLPSKSGNEKVFHCTVCKYQTTSKQSYERHLSTHKNGGRYSCTFCSKSYLAEWVLNRHIHAVHKVVETKKTKGKMPSPIKVKEEVIDDSEGEVCTICNVEFSSKDEYKHHIKTHTQVSIEQPLNDNLKNKKKRYYCTICKADFSSKDHANTHTGLRPYSCHVCSKSFSAYDSLRKHRYTKNHKEKENAKNPKKYVCDICHKEFQEAAELFAHNCQTSSGESVYRCQICKNAYLGRTALIDHMRIHVGQN
ncbi:hypothetical protein FQR65_LT05424 [Abscondita terminalis]|nr:hypothetical protein FQR65_LT05424 [Abscondita terminalis]